jgi:hypothetical protein
MVKKLGGVNEIMQEKLESLEKQHKADLRKQLKIATDQHDRQIKNRAHESRDRERSLNTQVSDLNQELQATIKEMENKEKIV